MTTYTICEKLVEASKEDIQICAFLHTFIAENGRLFVAIDNAGEILRKYNSINGNGSGRIKHWLRLIMSLSLTEKYDISLSPTKYNTEKLEIYLKVSYATKGKKLLCYNEIDYLNLLKTNYSDIELISREQIRSNHWRNEMAKFKITILFLAAEPTDSGRLRLGQEHREIERRLNLAKLKDKFNLEQVFAVRAEDFTEALLHHNPTIVHFAGHGTSEGSICIEDTHGKSLPVDSKTISALFEAFKGQVKCVVLNACYSKEQAKEISKHIDYVVGIPNSIKDDSAIAYSLGFYQAIGAGKSFSESHNLGCIQIGLQGLDNNFPPELITNKQGSGS